MGDIAKRKRLFFRFIFENISRLAVQQFADFGHIIK